MDVQSGNSCDGDTNTLMQIKEEFTVPGVSFSQSPGVTTKQAALSHFWNDSHLSLSLSHHESF